MAQPLPRELTVAVSIGQICVTVSAEDGGYNPSIARDLRDHAQALLHDAMQEAYTFGLLDIDEDEEVAELLTSNEVTFNDGSGQDDEE